MKKEICEHCKYWAEWPEQRNPQVVIGDCRRHAPQNYPTRDGKFMTKFPSTKHDDFCGSFRPGE
jgi:hypothetical protein